MTALALMLALLTGPATLDAPQSVRSAMADEMLAGLDPDAEAKALTFEVEDAALDARGRLLPMYEYDGDANRLTVRLHAGQRQMWDAGERWLLMLAGTQGGKTSFAPIWLLREMGRMGMGDYLFVAPTFKLLDLKALPEFRRLFVETLRLGKLTEGNAPRFTMSADGERRLFGRVRTKDEDETRTLFGHAQDPDSLESATAKGAVLDEAGQKKFKKGSFEAIERRLSLAEGRALLPTTPYTLGWLKDMHDRAGPPGSEKATASDTALVQFESVDNPAFPRAEFERQRALKPSWKFNMMYRGRFERPAGLIYDVWDEGVHVTQDRPHGTEVAGLDFGAVNTAAAVATLRPGSLCYVLTRFYQAGSRTAAEHADKLAPRDGKGNRPARPSRAWGGAPSEDNWRREFSAAGYPVAEPPVRLVEVGIDRAYALLKNHPALHGAPDPGSADGAVIVHDPTRPWIEAWEGAEGFADFKDQIESYSRELDDDDEPTEKIEDKSRFHLLDAFRYLAAGLASPAPARRRSRVSSPLTY